MMVCKKVVFKVMRTLLLVPISFSFSGHGQASHLTPTPTYDELHPYYISYCSGTRYHPKNIKDKSDMGNPGGHSFVFLKGVCKDKSQKLPQVKMCEGDAEKTLEEKLKDPEVGVGVSTDGGFKNINAIVVPGRSLFFYGEKDLKHFDEAKKKEIIEKAVEEGVFDGVHAHEKFIPKSSYTDEASEKRAVAEYTFGTDFAVSLARTIYCVNEPVTKEMMIRTVKKFNKLNKSYEENNRDFEWDLYGENCTHTANNIFAEFGVSRYRKTKQPWYKKLFHLAFPANVLFELSKNTVEGQGNYEKTKKDQRLKETFKEYSWLPSRPGAILEVVPFFSPSENQVYEKDDKMVVLGIPWNRQKKLRKLFRTKEYTDLKANLLHYKKLYTAEMQKTIEKVAKIQKKGAKNSYQFKEKAASKLRRERDNLLNLMNYYGKELDEIEKMLEKFKH